jgi:hypothetical protein
MQLTKHKYAHLVAVLGRNGCLAQETIDVKIGRRYRTMDPISNR